MYTMNQKENIYILSDNPENNNPEKSKFKPDIWKILGVDFFQDYLLPTNPDSKVKLFRKLWWHSHDAHSIKAIWIKERIKTWLRFGLWDLANTYMFIDNGIKETDNLHKYWYYSAGIVFLYALLVQIRTISRINKIMNYKNLKTKLPQKIDINN